MFPGLSLNVPTNTISEPRIIPSVGKHPQIGSFDVPRTISGWKKHAQIGSSGKDGTAYKVTHDSIHGEYVMKEFKKSKSTNKVSKEARIQTHATSFDLAPGIVSVNTKHNPPHIVMMNAGITIIDLINQQDGELTDEQQRILIRGIERMYEIGVIHNDPNPRNFMFRKENGKWKVWFIDFGFSEMIKEDINIQTKTSQTIKYLLQSYVQGIYQYLVFKVDRLEEYIEKHGERRE